MQLDLNDIIDEFDKKQKASSDAMLKQEIAEDLEKLNLHKLALEKIIAEVIVKKDHESDALTYKKRLSAVDEILDQVKKLVSRMDQFILEKKENNKNKANKDHENLMRALEQAKAQGAPA